MKTFREFCEEADYAQVNLAFEATGFKGEIGKKKLLNKLDKKDRKTAKQRRADKLQDLLSRPNSWKNLK